ncbi:MAG: glycoside hydrolase family 88 protein [Bacteroidales bacterium]|nr:glycoside hydrolase family 88 protein [Bacteroidales bacterium]
MENTVINTNELSQKLNTFFKLSGEKIKDIESNYDSSKGSPVFTVNGRYTTRGWTEWTEGFVYGSMLLQYDATRDSSFLEIAKKNIIDKMTSHVSHFGVHDHGFNNVSTYGNLLRMMNEGILPEEKWEREFYTMAINQSASVQANRWTDIPDGGFIYSFNGPHSLFVDTIRTCRVLMLAHKQGHHSLGEHDKKINLLERGVKHFLSTAKYSVFYGNGRDSYDIRGRVSHEAVFNVNDGCYRCPNSQQGYSGFTTWTRGLAWAILGFAEELEFFETLKQKDFTGIGDKNEITELMLKAAKASCDFYIENTPIDGVPYWDTGAPGLAMMGDYLNRKSEPFNDYEPVDSSAAAIAAQGFLRLGKYLKENGEEQNGDSYYNAGLIIASTIFSEPYLSTDSGHQGLILHSIYHRPNGWDNIPENSKIPAGESSMWGDYHARELALYLKRLLNNETYYTFFN